MSSTRLSGASKMLTLRSPFPLSDDSIRNFAPSVFATEKHDSRGERYAFIPTYEVLAGLRREGFQPYEVRQTRVRLASKVGHTKHMIRMRHSVSQRVGDSIYEIILLNSHDGTSAYRLVSGAFRFICDNGLAFGDISTDVKVRHSGKVVHDVIEGAFRVMAEASGVHQSIDEMRSLTLDAEERHMLAGAAHTIRWGDNPAPVQASQLLLPRRFEDDRADLWTNFNVVQENIVKGGIPGKTTTGRNTTTRQVTGVSESMRVNRALWRLADTFAGLKTGRVDPQELRQQLDAEFSTMH
jgi:hypothetical protein